MITLSEEQVLGLIAHAKDQDAARWALQEVLLNATRQHGDGIERINSVSSTVYIWNTVKETGLHCAGIGLSMVQGVRGRQVGGKWVAAVNLNRCEFQALDLEALMA